MDFNTGSGSGGSRRPNGSSRPLYGGESARPVGEPIGSSGADFNLSDPVSSFVRTVREIVLNPVGFFRGLPRQGGFVSPLVFALICAEIATLFFLVVGLVFDLLFGLFSNGSSGQSFIALVIFPIGVLVALPISLFVGAGIYHLAAILLVKPTNAGYEASFRAVAYPVGATLVLAPLNVIPFLGFVLYLLLASVYNAFLTVVAVRELHSTTTGVAVLVYLLPVIVSSVLGFVLSLLIGVLLAAAFSNS